MSDTTVEDGHPHRQRPDGGYGDADAYDEQDPAYEQYDEYDEGYADEGSADDGYADDRYDEGYDEGEYEDDHEGYAGDYVYVRKESGAARKTVAVLAIMAIVIVAVLGTGALWVANALRGGEQTGAPFSVKVPEGATIAEAGDLLQEKGVIKSGTVFTYYAKWKNLNQVKAGEYDQLYRGMSLDDAITRLRAGPLPERFATIAFPEGLRLKDVHSKALNTFPEMAEGELTLAEFAEVQKAWTYHQAGQSLEGFLFPATYEVETKDAGDEVKLLEQMLGQFDQVGNEIGLNQATQKLQGVAGNRAITPYEAVIVASMIEKEAKVPEDRAKIARVIYNRLKVNMKLQIDATTQYCFPENKPQLTQSDLNSDCPYNTRNKSGLPPTPIANPGRASLEAALNPEPGPWLFYVLSDKDGHHFFTDKESEFNKAVDEARKNGLL